MKARESGMPDEDDWRSFFDADCIIRNLECAEQGDESVVELGLGLRIFNAKIGLNELQDPGFDGCGHRRVINVVSGRLSCAVQDHSG